MSLLPEEASFAELVQECFVAFRGQGLMLSPLDAQLLAQWAALQVPFEVVARGIRRAAEQARFDARPGEPAPRTLRACKKEVEKEIALYRSFLCARAAEPIPSAEPRDAAVPLSSEDLAVARRLRALPFRDRLRLLREARARNDSFPMSWRARRLARRFHRARVLEAHLAGMGA